MTLSIEPIIYILVFVGVLALVEGLYLTIFGRSISLNTRINRRMEMLDKGVRRDEVVAKLRKEMQQHMNAGGIPLYSILADRAQKAAIAFTPVQLIMIMMGLTAVAFVALSLAVEAGFATRLIVAVGMGFGGVFVWVNHKAKQRIGMIEEQLPDAVELMVRSLRIGHPFSSAIQIVARETSDPLATEFGIIADEAAYGRDIGEALKDLAERLDIQDIRFLAVAVTIQLQSGGNLAEILSGLAKVIRDRFRLFRRVRAITAEAKWSGNFLSGFPVFALIAINLLDPHYYDEVIDHPWFVPACFVVGGFLIANIIVMRMLVNIKV